MILLSNGIYMILQNHHQISLFNFLKIFWKLLLLWKCSDKSFNNFGCLFFRNIFLSFLLIFSALLRLSCVDTAKRTQSICFIPTLTFFMNLETTSLFHCRKTTITVGIGEEIVAIGEEIVAIGEEIGVETTYCCLS